MTLQRLFGIDPRSLAVFRMAMGALLLVDLAVRITDLNVMYTDDGMFPRAEICRRATTIWNWSFHFGSGSWGYQGALFGMAAVLALALLVGFETRLAVIGSWLMLVSVHHRVPPILSGAENLLRMLLFWAMFLPLGRAWSLDRWLNKRPSSGARAGDEAGALSIASAAILLQMALMYFFSAISKSNSVWFRGEAVAGILGHDFYAAPAAAYLLQFPPLLLIAMTWGTLILEWLAPLLLFFPVGTARLRLAGIAALAVMHILIGVCLEVGLFSYVSLVGLILFVPAQFWHSRLRAHFWRMFERAPPLADAGPGVQSGSNDKNAGPKEIGQPFGSAVRPAGFRQHPAFFYAAQGLCLLLLIYVFALNLNSFPNRLLAPLAPEKWRLLTRGFGLSQSWGMFASIPSKDGWYVARAKLRDGSEIDLLRDGAALDWNRPPFPARLYPNHYWQKLFREMAYDDEQGFQLLRVPVAQFLCRNWNARHPAEKQVAEFEFVYCMETEAEGTNRLKSRIRERLVHLELGEHRYWATSPAAHPVFESGAR